MACLNLDVRSLCVKTLSLRTKYNIQKAALADIPIMITKTRYNIIRKISVTFVDGDNHGDSAVIHKVFQGAYMLPRQRHTKNLQA